MGLKANISIGIERIKEKETWRKIGGGACGMLFGSLAVSVTDKLTSNSNRVLRYSSGTLSSGLVTVLLLGMDYKVASYGAGMVSAGQAINTVTSLVFNKDFNELLNN